MNNSTIRRLTLGGVCLPLMFVIAVHIHSADAVPISFSGTGLGATGNVISSEATLDKNGDELILTLTNTTVGGTQVRGDSLTDFFFTLNDADPTLTFTMGSGTVVEDGQPTIMNADLRAKMDPDPGDGEWQLKQFPGGTFPDNDLSQSFPYEYGLSTVGDTGLFNGNVVGGYDYGIIAPGTDISIGGFKNEPWVQTTATFTLTGFSGIELSQIDDAVRFSYGSKPDAVIDVPEPGCLTLACLGICAFTRRARRHWRRSPVAA